MARPHAVRYYSTPSMCPAQEMSQPQDCRSIPCLLQVVMTSSAAAISASSSAASDGYLFKVQVLEGRGFGEEPQALLCCAAFAGGPGTLVPAAAALLHVCFMLVLSFNTVGNSPPHNPYLDLPHASIPALTLLLLSCRRLKVHAVQCQHRCACLELQLDLAHQ
jgi:hypothetical protein